MRALTVEQFLSRSREAHGDRYEYDAESYSRASKPVRIKCADHGWFEQNAGVHMRGSGCPVCVGNKALTLDDFIYKARKTHGDRFSYGRAQYKNANSKLCITCPEHGDFWQTPSNHLSGYGCQKCGQETLSAQLRMSTEDFVTRAKEVHGGAYDYAKVDYTGSADKVCIVCPKHGEFWQEAKGHLQGYRCPKCSAESRTAALTDTLDDFVAKAREVHGDTYSYVKSAYTKSQEKLCITCSEHGDFWQTPNSHLNGSGCPVCAGCQPLTTESFKSKARKVHGDTYGYSKVIYTRSADKVCLVCPKHGEFWQEANSHLCGHGCPVCAGKQPDTLKSFIAKAREVHGDRYDYSNTVYSKSKGRVRIVCPEHGVFEQLAGNHRQGQGCPRCAVEASAEARLDTLESFTSKAQKIHGDKYDYSKVLYTGTADKVHIICPEHGNFLQTPGGHLQGQGCPKCGYEVVAATLSGTLESFIAKSREVHGDRYSYERAVYTGTKDKLRVTCPVHGDFWQLAGNHSQGQGCPKCTSQFSKGHQMVAEFLQQYTTVELESNLNGALGRKRLDIYLPDLNLAVEYHGLIWHSTRYLKGAEARTKDYEKHKLAEEAGVRVIHIYEDEWVNKQDVVKRTLMSAVGVLPKVGARKTKVVEVSRADADAFYEANHLQGSVHSQINLGLEHDGRLVACMSFGMLRSVRNNRDKSKWELTRYAATCTVSGGASKLFKAFLKLGLAQTVTSYTDIRAFSGKMYTMLGFRHVHSTPPDYMYVTGGTQFGRKHKAKFQKAKLKKMFPGADIEGQTELQITESNGLYRIYDCGKARYDYEVGSD